MRRTILIISFLFLSKVTYSQTEFCLGKFYNEVQQSKVTTPTSFRGRNALYQVVDTNTLVYYIFSNGICVEYNSVFRTENIDSVQRVIKNYLLDPQVKMSAYMRRIDSTNLYNLIIDSRRVD